MGGLAVVQLINFHIEKNEDSIAGNVLDMIEPIDGVSFNGSLAVGVLSASSPISGTSVAYGYVMVNGDILCKLATSSGNYTGQIVFPVSLS